MVDVKSLASIIVATVGLFVCGCAFAQRSLDAPPPLPPSTPASPQATPAATAPQKDTANRHTVARLPEADRASQDAAAPVPQATTEPPDDQLLPPAKHVAPATRIEQVRQGNRVVEIIVTPQGATSSYVIINREGRPPLSTQELSSGLSTPRFLRFDF